VIVLANHKGGVTKTTSTANLAAMLAEAGRRVLIVDCDPQANLSEAFGWYADIPGERLEDLLENPDAADRYAPVARAAGFPIPANTADSLTVVERVKGNATTDYGAPGLPAKADAEPDDLQLSFLPDVEAEAGPGNAHRR